MTTITRIERGLMARVPAVSSVTISDGPNPIAHVVVPSPTAELEQEIQRVLNDLVAAHSQITAKLCDAPVEGTTPPSGKHRLANLAATTSTNGLIEGLKSLVPEVDRVIVAGVDQDRVLQIRVGDYRGVCSSSLLGSATRAVGALVCLGDRYNVSPLLPEDITRRRRERESALPTSSWLRDVATEDDDEFARRLDLLVGKNQEERIPLLDDLDGERICTTIGAPDSAPVGAFLPIYDRILLLLVPDRASDGDEYFQRNYGMARDQFHEYARARKIIPIFKFELGRYPEAVWRGFKEDPSLPFVTPRAFDYVCARHAWRNSGWLREVREDREVSALLSKAAAAFPASRGPERSVTNVLQMIQIGVEAFEGDMWHRGHLGLSSYSPAMPFIEMMREMIPSHSDRAMARIEVEGAAMHLAIGQALGAATHEGLVRNEQILLKVAEIFGGEAPSLLTSGQGSRLVEVLRGLELAYSPRIPAKEYIEIFDQANTKRLRRLVSDLVRREDRYTELEIREIVQGLNQGVDSIDRQAVEAADVSLITSGASAATGVPVLSTILKTGSNISGLIGRKLDARTGEALDRMRGWINRVPPQSIRLYKIRRKLRKATK